jgi:ABC-type Na+ transport system ATPase subunit NatA
MRNMKIVIRKSDSGYEVELSEEEVLTLFRKILEILDEDAERETKKIKEEFQDILDQFLGRSP